MSSPGQPDTYLVQGKSVLSQLNCLCVIQMSVTKAKESTPWGMAEEWPAFTIKQYNQMSVWSGDKKGVLPNFWFSSAPFLLLRLLASSRAPFPWAVRQTIMISIGINLWKIDVTDDSTRALSTKKPYIFTGTSYFSLQ